MVKGNKSFSVYKHKMFAASDRIIWMSWQRISWLFPLGRHHWCMFVIEFPLSGRVVLTRVSRRVLWRYRFATQSSTRVTRVGRDSRNLYHRLSIQYHLLIHVLNFRYRYIFHLSMVVDLVVYHMKQCELLWWGIERIIEKKFMLINTSKQSNELSSFNMFN